MREGPARIKLSVSSPNMEFDLTVGVQPGERVADVLRGVANVIVSGLADDFVDRPRAETSE